MFYTILPQCIITIIYTYDNTYHLYYKDTLHQIYIYGFKTRLNKLIYAPCLKQHQLVGVHKTTYSLT